MGDPRKALQNLQDAMVDDIMSMSEKKLRAEMIEYGLDPDAEIARVEAIIEKAIEREHIKRKGPATPEEEHDG